MRNSSDAAPEPPQGAGAQSSADAADVLAGSACEACAECPDCPARTASGFSPSARTDDAELGALSDEAVLDAVLANAAERRRLDRESARLADEVQRRSAKELGEEGLAARYAFSSGIDLLEDLTGDLPATLVARAKLGDAIREPEDWYGSHLPPRFPHVAAAMKAGVIGADQALAAIRDLDSARPAGNPIMLDRAERTLVNYAAGGSWRPPDADDPEYTDSLPHPDAAPLPARFVAKLATEWRVRIDTDGVEPRADLQHRRRSFTWRQNPDGTYTARITLPPEDFADVKALMEAKTSPRTKKAGAPGDTGADAGASAGDSTEAGTESPSRFTVEGDATDTRTPAQKRADAFMDLIHAAASSTDAPLIGGHDPTGLVIIPITEMNKTGGVAFVHGVDPPVPARRMIEQIACTGTIQYLLVDEAGMPLKLGREQRLFSRAQRRALAARDKTCFVDGCDAPASSSDVHHITAYSRGGPTDIENAVIACRHHHTLIHSGRLRVVLRPGLPPAAVRLKNPRKP